MRVLLIKLFYPLFFLLFLLSFFLMETEFKLFLFLIWALFLLLYSFFANISFKEKRSFKILFFSYLFLFLALFSVLFSHHLPLSLEKYLFYVFAITIFIFFLKIDKKLFNPKFFFEYLSILIFILNILVLFLTIYGNSRSFFQGMNLLIRSYGHNHYVAFLILVLPLIWWRLFNVPKTYFFNKKIKLFVDIFLLISSYLIVLISLSRLGLLIAIAQFFFIFLSNRHDFHNFRKNKVLYFLIKSSIFLFLFLSLIFISLSLPFSSDNKKNCLLKIYRKDLCISIAENSRFFYWYQAWSTFKNYPVFGYGLNTFKHVARRFPLVNQQHSTYAHNVFLHNLAEMGMLGGGMFVFLIIYIFYQSTKVVKKSRNNLHISLYIGAISSFTNAMFDFDWHFFVIFLLTLIFLAFILSESMTDKSQKKTSKLWQIYLIFISVISALLFLANVLTIRWQNVKPDYWLKYTPFLSVAVEAPYADTVNTVANYQSLYKLYRYDTGFILRFLSLEKELDQQFKKQLYLDLAEIDPAAFATKIDFQNWNFADARLFLDKLVQIIEKHSFFDQDYFINYWRRLELAKEVFALAQKAYLIKDWENAGYFYYKAYYFDQYIFFKEKALFLNEENLENLVQFTLHLQKISPHDLGDFYKYMYLYKGMTTQLFIENRLLDFEQLMIKMLDLEVKAKSYLTKHLYELAENDDQKAILQKIDKKYSVNSSN